MLMEMITSYFFPLLFIVGITLFNSIIFKKKFEIVAVFSLLQSALIVYVFGFVNLRIGFICTVIMAALAIPLYVYVVRKKEYSLEEFYLTDLFWSFLILYSILFVMNLGKSFYKWDEYSHWGMMAKEMVRLDMYYYVEDSVLVHHREYPPFTTVLQYIWCKLCGGYEERHLYNAKLVFSLSTFFPIYAWLTSKMLVCKGKLERIVRIVLIPALFIVLSCVMELGEASYYRTIYTEGILCVLFVYAVFSVMVSEKANVFSIANIAMALAAILLTKQMGLFFAAIVVVYYFITKFLKKEIKLCRWEILFTIATPFLLWGIWKIMVTLNAPFGQFDASKFSIGSILDIFTGKGLEYQYITIEAYWNAIFKTPLLYKPIGLSYTVILFLFAFLMFATMGLQTDIVAMRELLVITILLETGAIGYIFVMQVLYLFGFSEGEATGLASYARYMTTMLYPMLLIAAILLFTTLLSRWKRNSNVFIGVVVLLLLVTVIPVSFVKTNLLPGVFYDDPADLYKGDARIIMENTEENAKIYLICQGDNGSGRNMISYLAAPRLFSEKHYSLNSSEDGSLSMQEMLDYAGEFEYIYLSNIDDAFVEDYQDAFPSLVLTNQQLFKVIKSSEEITLQRVY